ncbi:TetR family transcriptional regulator C-terminal domain-containing protein [Streptomyces sp. NPDC089922]|uniref:TetR/AcrR family transcriptional regulator n=1 Tax=unclassified Streptomyces TaxID=2593676 RepID=UPI00341AD0D6
MPRQVDHEGRRRLVAEAVCGLADERGLEGVTLRDVAARAQVSMGAVQRCFRTKDEMLVFALAAVGERIGARVRARLVRTPAQSAASAVGHAATEIALLDEQHRSEARVWLAFLAQAAVDETLAETMRRNQAALQEVFTGLISQACQGQVQGGDGDGAVALDAAREARTVLALADGLTAHVLVGHLTPAEAQEVLHSHLSRLWASTQAPGPH